MSEEWVDASVGTCDHCGRSTAVVFIDDPYLDEVWDEQKPSWWCGRCYGDRRDEV